MDHHAFQYAFKKNVVDGGWVAGKLSFLNTSSQSTTNQVRVVMQLNKSPELDAVKRHSINTMKESLQNRYQKRRGPKTVSLPSF